VYVVSRIKCKFYKNIVLYDEKQTFLINVLFIVVLNQNNMTD